RGRRRLGVPRRRGGRGRAQPAARRAARGGRRRRLGAAAARAARGARAPRAERGGGHVSALAIAGLTLRARRRRILALLAFAAVFLAAALTARLLVSQGEGGQIEMDRLFLVGGYPLVSALLLLGWVLGRYPLVAPLDMLAGVISHDRAAGYALVYGLRP